MSAQNQCGSVKWANRQVGIKSGTEVDADTLLSGVSLNGFTATAPTQKYYFTCDDTGTDSNLVRGVQSLGYDANFELNPNFEFMDFEPYHIEEGVPSVDITVSKILDGYPLVYLLYSKDANAPTLSSRTACKAAIASAVFPCTQQQTSETPNVIVVFPEAQVNSLSYTFGTDNTPFTEDLSFVGNDVLWINPVASGTDSDDNTDVSNITDCSGVNYTSAFLNDAASVRFQGCGDTRIANPACTPQYSQHFKWDYNTAITDVDDNAALCDPDTTVLPPTVPGINCDGTNWDGTEEQVCVSSITVSADLNREDVNCLGRRGPKFRTITPPITVTTAIEVTSEFDHAVSAFQDGVFESSITSCACSGVGENLRSGTIRIATCDGTRIYTGTKNKFQTVSTAGGSTDGDNLTVTYTFQSFNVLTIMQEDDPNPLNTSGTSPWWANRSDHLCDIV